MYCAARVSAPTVCPTSALFDEARLRWPSFSPGAPGRRRGATPPTCASFSPGDASLDLQLLTVQRATSSCGRGRLRNGTVSGHHRPEPVESTLDCQTESRPGGLV